MVGSGWRLRYGKLFLCSLAPSSPPWFSAAAVGGEHREAQIAAAAASSSPGSRAAGQVLSTSRASLATSFLCPAVRLPQRIWGVGGRWAPGRGGGGGCGAGQKQPPIPAAGEPRAPGAPAIPGLNHGDLCERQHRPRLLQPQRRSHDDRGFSPPGEPSGGLPAAAARELQAPFSRSGAGPRPGHRLWEARGRASWVRGLATHRRAPTGHLGEPRGSAWARE